MNYLVIEVRPEGEVIWDFFSTYDEAQKIASQGNRLGDFSYYVQELNNERTIK